MPNFFFLVLSLALLPSCFSTEEETLILQKIADKWTNFDNFLWTSSEKEPCAEPVWQYINCTNGSVTTLALPNAYVGGYLSELIGELKNLRILILDSNNLTGRIPSSLGKLTYLTELTLSGNKFTGSIPPSLSNLTNLNCFDLSNNSLSGSIPSGLSKYPCSAFKFNSNLISINCSNGTTCSRVELYSSGSSNKLNTLSLLAIIISVIGGLLLVLCIFLFIVFVKKRNQAIKAKKEHALLAEHLEEVIARSKIGNLRRFTFEELNTATNGFDKNKILGEGSFSKVYKGVLPDSTTIAVKRIKKERGAGEEVQFINEVEVVSRALHRNLLPLVGFCAEVNECILVFPFLGKGSVASCLQAGRQNPANVLSWEKRKSIARGTAQGLAYLHYDCDPKIIHRDIKAANIFLTEKYEPVVGDFGLAKQVDFKKTHATTAVKGTMGHIAPEYFVSGQTSEKTDVYAFGVFLMELVSGRDVFDLTMTPESDGLYLYDWVTKLLNENRAEEILDEALKNQNIVMKEVEVMLHVAVKCISQEASKRPTMLDCTNMFSATELSRQWKQWQEEANRVSFKEVTAIMDSQGIWDNLDSGISLDAFHLSGPR